MSKQVLVSRESVFAAANAIKARNGRVSYRQIARELGGGSHRDIGPFLREWLAQQEANAHGTSSTQPIPTEVERQFRDGLNCLQELVRQDINGQFEVQRKGIQRRIDAALRECDDANADVEESESELAELHAQLTVVSGQLAAERERSDSLMREITTECDQRALAAAREAEVRRMVSELQIEREANKASLDRERQSVATLRERESELLRELEHERVERAKAEALNGSLQAQLDSVTARTRQCEAETSEFLLQTRQEMTSLRGAYEAAANDANRLRESVETLQTQLVQLLPSAENQQTSRRKQ